MFFYTVYTVRGSAPPQALGGASKPVKPTKLVDFSEKKTQFIHFISKNFFQLFPVYKLCVLVHSIGLLALAVPAYPGRGMIPLHPRSFAKNQAREQAI